MLESSMPWVKMYIEMLDDAKLGRLSNSVRWRFVSLILLAGECDAEGYLAQGSEPMTIEEIAWRLRCDVRVLTTELMRLESLTLVENTDCGWKVRKFSERQGRKQSVKRAEWRDRQTRHRHKDLSETEETPGNNVPVTRDTRVSHASRGEEEVEEEKIKTPQAAGAAPAPLTPGQKLFAERWNAKRLNPEQKAAISALETQYGLPRLTECVVWAREKNLALGQAIGSIRTAIKHWGEPKAGANGKKPSGMEGWKAWTPEKVAEFNAKFGHQPKKPEQPA